MITSNSASQVDVPHYGTTQKPGAEGNHSGRVVVSQLSSSSINSTPPPTSQKIIRHSQYASADVSAHEHSEGTKLINDTNQEQQLTDASRCCSESLEACCILTCWLALTRVG